MPNVEISPYVGNWGRRFQGVAGILMRSR